MEAVVAGSALCATGDDDVVTHLHAGNHRSDFEHRADAAVTRNHCLRDLTGGQSNSRGQIANLRSFRPHQNLSGR